MTPSWKAETISSEEQLFRALEELQGKRWLFRGQSKAEWSLDPSINRCALRTISRSEKLKLERQSVELFRSAARFFASAGEHGALSDDVIALMVLRHYGVPSRLLDWSFSPYVAAYFSVCEHDSVDGAIWAFDEPLYERKGKGQWLKIPETTTDGSGDPNKFDAKLTIFSANEPRHWFCCGFYPMGFPRQNAQSGAYSITPGFARDHADAIAELLGDQVHCHRYVVESRVKPRVKEILHEKYGISRAVLFPDTAGAADTARRVFLDEEQGTG